MHLVPGRQVEEPRDLTLDQFLKFPVVTRGEAKSTVRDVVDHIAHNRGGVYRIPESTADTHPVAKAQAGMLIGDYDHPLAMLREIGLVTLDGLKPLTEKCREEMVILERFQLHQPVHGGGYREFDSVPRSRKRVTVETSRSDMRALRSSIPFLRSGWSPLGR